jgi:AraC-like DNA-binding protein
MRAARIGRAAEIRLTRVFALVNDPVGRARVSQAFRQSANVDFIASIEAQRGPMEDSCGKRACLLVEYGSAPYSCPPITLRDLVQRHPTLPVIGYVTDGTAKGAAVATRELARAGVKVILVRDFDDNVLGFQNALNLASAGCVANKVALAVQALVADELWPFTKYCLCHPAEAAQLDNVARALGLSRRALEAKCSRFAMCPPGEAAMRIRLMTAAYLLEGPDRTVEAVAHALEFPSAVALANACRRYFGAAPGRLRVLAMREGAVRSLATGLKRAPQSAPRPAA